MMEPRPADKMPPNPLEPLVRAVVHNALVAFDRDWCIDATSIPHLAAFVARRLCETIDQDGWDYSDRVRRASTKHTWKLDDDAPPIAGEDA